MSKRITAEECRQQYGYEQETGRFFRLSDGYEGCLAKSGHRFIGRSPVHRLIWLYAHGYWPPHDIDHINGVRADNRLSNLRLATRSQNIAAGRNNPNSSGFRGVYKHERCGARPWQARIKVRGRYHSLGYFASAIEAHRAWQDAALRHFGEYARVLS